MDFKIKICGMKYPGNFSEVSSLQPDYIGLIFYKNSPRYMRDELTLADVAATKAKKTGVFVNAPIEEVEAAIADYKLDAIQLHGQESPEYCSHFINQIEVIKAFAVNDEFNFNDTAVYEKACSQFLFDTKGSNAGGNGFAFNWEMLKNYKQELPFFLSGGLGLSNIDTALDIIHKKLYGIDINSGAEISPGIKDINTVKQLIDTVKAKIV